MDVPAEFQTFVAKAVEKATSEQARAFYIFLFGISSIISTLFLWGKRTTTKLISAKDDVIKSEKSENLTLNNRIKLLEETLAKINFSHSRGDIEQLLREQNGFLQRTVESIREEQQDQQERRLTKTEEQVKLITDALNEATNASYQNAQAHNTHTESIRTLDHDIRSLQQITNDVRQDIRHLLVK